MSVFNTEKTADQYGESPLFFGTAPGLFDTINKVYPEIWDLYKEMKKLDWSEDEFDYSQCNIDFKTVHRPTAEKMKKTLIYQWEQDSVAARAIAPVLAPFITNSELWAMYQRISDNECLVPEHEVLTKDRGWVRIADVGIGDTVVQYNPATMKTEFAIVSETISKKYVGDIIEFWNTNNTFNQRVTPGHRMATRRMHGPNVGHEFHEARGCPKNGSMSFIVSGDMLGGCDTLTAKDRLWIAFQADGSYPGDAYNGGRTGLVPLKFSFKKERKKIRLLELASIAGYDVREYDITASKPGYSCYHVMVPVDEMRDTGKTFGWVNVSDVSGSWCRAFLDELKNWDACERNLGRCLMTYASTSDACVDVVKTIAALAGFRSKTSKYARGGNRKECYQISITSIPYVTGNTVKTRHHEYDGMVHCITVPSGAFLTRINGIISVTGNCIHAATYSEIVRMSFDDPKAVLVETLEMKETIQRMEVIIGIMDDLAQASHQYALGLIPANQELFNKLYLFVVALFIMERVQFMASFGVTFTICASGPFQPIGQAVKKIAQDELEVHVQAGKAVLKILHNTEMGRIAREQTKATVESIFAAVVNSEFTFIDWLFSDGEPMIGTNADFLKKWVLFCGKDPVTFLGLEHPFGKLPKENPMPHLEKWIDMNKLQAAPMEQDHGQYKVGVVVDDSAGENFDDFL